MTHSTNVIVIAFIVVLVVLALYFLLKKDFNLENTEEDRKNYLLPNLIKGIKEIITAIQNTNIAELNLNKVETKKREDLKATLDRAMRYCCTGAIGLKEYLKEYIAELLQDKFNINNATINYIVPFDTEEDLTTQEKFDILLYLYRKKYKDEGFAKLVEEHKLDKSKSNEDNKIYYSIDNEEIEKAYHTNSKKLTFVEKLDIVSQWIYQSFAGHGVIDALREEKSIDGISGGVSGMESASYEFMEEILMDQGKKHNRYDSIWIVFGGKEIWLKFMTFGTQRELERVTHNLYRNGNPGWMSSLKGYIQNDTKDGNRITCSRPPFSESYAFWIRKFDSSKPTKLENLIKQDGCEIPIYFIRSLIKGGVSIVFTGEMDSGKTTTLKGAVGEIDNTYPIRTIEPFYEMWLSRLYPDKNITGFRFNDSISVSEAITFIKKSSAKVIIAGESADFETAAKTVEVSLVGPKYTLSTCHPMTTEGLIEYHTNAVMSKNIALYSDDKRAEASVAKALNFDIHMNKSKDGERHIERITEIIPINTNIEEWPEDINECKKLHYKLLHSKSYYTRDLVVFENGQYVLKHSISPNMLERMFKNYTEQEIEEYNTFIKRHMRV